MVFNDNEPHERIRAAAGVVNTGLAYNDLLNGNVSPITYADAGIGSAGVYNTFLKYAYKAEIPVVGEFVSLYGLLRIVTDVFSDLGERYGPRLGEKDDIDLLK